MSVVRIGACAFAVGMLFSTAGLAAAMTKAEFKAGNAQIAVDYKSAKDGCKSLSGNPADVCMLEAEGRSSVAQAELKALYQPSVKNRYKASVVRAEADYAVAKEKCDDTAGNVKDVCVKEAKSVEIAAKADAKARMKISDANGTAVKETSAARRDAAEVKRDAEFNVAKEKCDVYAGEAKVHCMNEAKTAFGKS